MRLWRAVVLGALGVGLVAAAAAAAEGAALGWAIGLGGTSADTGYGVAVDGSGNTYVTGDFYGTVDFDPGAGTTNLTSAGDGDVFVAKYDSAGALAWAIGIGGTDLDVGYGVAVDGSGNTYVTGRFGGTADFDPGVGTTNLISGGGSDVFVAKYDSAGALVWAIGMGGGSSDVGNGVAVDGSGNTYVTGFFGGTADFDPGVGTTNLISGGNSDVFVAKYDSAGALVWAIGMGGGSSDQGKSVAVDGSGNTYVTGDFGGTADFDPGAGTTNLTSVGDLDVFVAKYDSAGTLAWAHGIGGTSTDSAYGVAVDGSGNAHITGAFYEMADFDPGAGTTNLISASQLDVYLAKYDPAGALVWANAIGGVAFEEGQGVAVDGSGNSYVTGFFVGTADFDPGPGTTNLTSAGSADVFVAKYDSAGALVWANRMGDTSADVGFGVAVDGSGNTYVAGFFNGMVDFDPGPGTTNLTSASSNDVFLTKLIVDSDGDGIPVGIDNCPAVKNANQADRDGDGIGNKCDPDVDGDGIDNGADNCPGRINANQMDRDHDGIGNRCDPDNDNDGVNDRVDNCPRSKNPAQADKDGDGIGNKCDPDADGDLVPNGVDNCPARANAVQRDRDGDGLGNKCDPDDDNDGVNDPLDAFPRNPNKW